MNRRVVASLAASALGLAGSLGATLALHASASAALDRVLEERLRGAGVTASELLERGEASAASATRLRAVMDGNRLEGASLLSPALTVVADAAGRSGAPADLLRLDPARVERAFRGDASIGRGYEVGGVRIDTAYFPVHGRDGAVALALAAGRWERSERAREAAAARAARGEAVARMAAGVAHDIRNPLGIIRAAVELVRERGDAPLDARDRRRLEDVLEEVERLRRLTQDFLELSADVALHLAPVALGAVAEDAARGSAAVHPALAVELAHSLGGLPPVAADAARLRQVLANLLSNAAEAGARAATVEGAADDDAVRLTVRDDGPGVDASVRERLFEAFATGRPGGTGLGLAVSRRIMERHGGGLALVDGPGTAFELRLPRCPEGGRR